MQNLLATVGEGFAEIDRLLRELRNRISRAAEAVHVVAENAVRELPSPERGRRAGGGGFLDTRLARAITPPLQPAELTPRSWPG